MVERCVPCDSAIQWILPSGTAESPTAPRTQQPLRVLCDSAVKQVRTSREPPRRRTRRETQDALGVLCDSAVRKFLQNAQNHPHISPKTKLLYRKERKVREAKTNQPFGMVGTPKALRWSSNLHSRVVLSAVVDQGLDSKARSRNMKVHE